MASNSVSKAEFARIAGVHESTITRLCKGAFKDSMEGKRINLLAGPVVEYLAKRKEPPKGQLDELYDSALAFCVENERWSASALRVEFGIGYRRATRLMDMLRINKAATRNKKGIKLGSPKLADTKPKPPKPVGNSGPDPVDSKPKLEPKPIPEMKIPKNGPLKMSDLPDPDTLHIPDNIAHLINWPLGHLLAKFGTDTAFLDWLRASKILEDIAEKRLKNAVGEGKLVSRELMKRGVFDQYENAHTRMLTDGVKKIVKEVSVLQAAGRDLAEMEEKVGDILGSLIRPAKAKIIKALNSK